MVEFSITPVDQGPHFTEAVAKVLRIIDESGLDYQLGPMGTTIEGEWPDVMALLQKCFDATAAGSDRVTFTLKADWKRGTEKRLSQKVRAVENRVGKPLKTRS